MINRQTDQEEVFGPVLPPTPIAPLSWAPQYPNQPDAGKLLGLTACLAPFLSISLTVATIATPFGWQPVYPEQHGERVTWETEAPRVAGKTIYLDWVFTQPDHVDRGGPHPATLGYFVKDPTPVVVPTGWWPQLNHAPTVRLVSEGWLVRPTLEPPDIQKLGWRGSQPAAIDRKLPDYSGWYARPAREPDDIARLGWRGTGPDQIPHVRAPWMTPWLIQVTTTTTTTWPGYQSPFGWR